MTKRWLPQASSMVPYMNRILVVRATGRVGRQVICQLDRTSARVRVLVRNPQTAELPANVEVVRGDVTVPGTLDQCLDAVDTVFLVWTAPLAAVDAALSLITSQARRIVFLSSPYKTAHPFFPAAQSAQVAARAHRAAD